MKETTTWVRLRVSRKFSLQDLNWACLAGTLYPVENNTELQVGLGWRGQLLQRWLRRLLVWQTGNEPLPPGGVVFFPGHDATSQAL